jgi:hypothetical protein
MFNIRILVFNHFTTWGKRMAGGGDSMIFIVNIKYKKLVKLTSTETACEMIWHRKETSWYLHDAP